MLSNFSTAYNVVNISLVLLIMKDPSIYGEGLSDEDPAVSACSYVLIGGMIFGQLVFGGLGDLLGLDLAMALAMGIQILGSFLSAFSVPLPGQNTSTVFFVLAFFRFVLGVGCGGVYPLAAALSARTPAKKEDRGQSVALVFSMQGVGYLAAPLLAFALLAIFGESNAYTWRVLLGVGCLPGLVLLHMRTKQARLVLVREREEEARRDKEAKRMPRRRSSAIAITAIAFKRSISFVVPVEKKESVWVAIRREENIVLKLVGTAGCWWLFDILFYGNTLFQPVVLDAAFGDGQTTTDTARDTVLVTCLAVPGYFVSVYFMSKLGPRRIQAQGFFFMSILYLSIGLLWSYMIKYQALLLVSYGLTFFFSNFGPNSTTFVLPSMTFSPSCRSTLNGLSAAFGKFGAFLGATLFAPAADEWGNPAVMIICGALAALGLVMTLFCVSKDVGRVAEPTRKTTIQIDSKTVQ